MIRVAGKGTIEIWEVSPTERIAFSTSGAHGQSEPEAIDVTGVRGLEDVRRIHIPQGS